MLMFQKKFDSYDEMLKDLVECGKVDKAEFEFKSGKWILNMVYFDKLS